MMSKKAQFRPKIGLALSTALVSMAITGCASTGATVASKSFEKAQHDLAKGKTGGAITNAEAAVQADPRNAGYRSVLGAAYLEAGRFQSAATSFNDAMVLGNTDARTVLSYALAETAVGNNAVALATLKQYRDAIDPADLGLAYALAGEPARGVHVLSNALRGGANNAKVRQNLAYSYALQGNWRAARLMAAEDVPANQINDRIAEWASQVGPQNQQARVAKLLSVTPVADRGQPTRLALNSGPSMDDMQIKQARNASYTPSGELAPVTAKAPAMAKAPTSGAKVGAPKIASMPVIAQAKTKAEAGAQRQPVRFAAAFGAPQAKAKPAPVSKAAPAAASSQPRIIARPVIQSLPMGYSETKSPKPAPRRVARPAPKPRAAAPAVAAAKKEAATHRIQLGSYNSRAIAEEASKKLQRRYSQLKGRDMVVTEARVKGKTYWRVAADGFGVNGAKSACSKLKAKGQACFAYEAGRKLPGAVNRGIRIAAR